MSLGLSGADAGHLAAPGAVTGVGFIGGGMVFRRAVGRDHMVVGLNTAAAIFAAAAIGLLAGQGRLMVAAAATALALFVLEIRHVRMLTMLDGRHWASRVPDDDPPPGSRPRAVQEDAEEFHDP